VTAGLQTMIYPAKDLAAAKGVYTALLGEPMFDAPYYVGWRIGNQDIGLDPSGHAQGMTGALGYYEVEDIECDPRRAGRCGCRAGQRATRRRRREADRGAQGRRRQHHRAQPVAVLIGAVSWPPSRSRCG
jgi:hypothetical protein